MKQLFTIFMLATLFSACQKESVAPEAGNLKETAVVLIQVEGISPICNAAPPLYPSPGVSIAFTSYTQSLVLALPGNMVVWMRPLGSSIWSSKTVVTPTANPVKVSYASCSPAMGAIAAGTVMELKVSQTGGINMTPIFNFTAINCVIGPR
jgi:hypothetical protein